MHIKLLIFGFLVHLIFLYSIFDIYFSSPLSHGMKSHTNLIAPPAQRLVIFSADGLRADKLFELNSGQTKTPYLRYIIENLGVWGVSHTRVPTESRPGHVAFIAGFYEDISAVTKGWKENPVEFDSVFNQSRYTWSWGSPDILPMFYKGISGNHLFMNVYPGESEDFAGSDITKLDTWVFDCVELFLKNASTDTRSRLQNGQIIFFLHLLGLDTTGHVHKPHSEEYVRNLKVVDDGVKRMVDVIESYFNHDGRTAYIFTSDHGMTDWGSHGAGDKSETETPFVAWGAGIRPPIHGEYRHSVSEWGLSDIERVDINQADICPLASLLIGIPIPHQSVGVVPVAVLNASMEFKSHSLFTNFKQIYEQYKIKEEEKKNCVFSWLFRPYEPGSKLAESLSEVESFILSGSYEQVADICTSLISIMLDGIQYYHQYERGFLGISMALCYLGWIAFLATKLIEEHTDVMKSSTSLSSSSSSSVRSSSFENHGVLNAGALIVSALVLFFLGAQYKPLMHYVYCLLPILLWYIVIRRRFVWKESLLYMRNSYTIRRFLPSFFVGILSLEVLIFSFIHRQLISIGLVSMSLWAVWNWRHFSVKAPVVGWIASCWLVSVFPVLPTVGSSSNYYLVYLSAIAALCLFVALAFKIYSSSMTETNSVPSRLLHLFQIVVVASSGILLHRFVEKRRLKSSSSIFLHLISWIILASSFVLPLIGSKKIFPRLASIALAFFPPYLLLSIAHESLFYLSFSILMLFWLQLETGMTIGRLSDIDFNEQTFEDTRHLRLSDVRCSFFFIFFLFTSFFGTGNLASVNSFDPTSILCFVTVFNPFVMGGLLVYKILIPVLVVASCYHAIQVAVNVPKQSFFILMLLISDYMALHFFFMIRDSGSWLEIGATISRYVIVMAFILFLFLVLSICEFITERSLPCSSFSFTRKLRLD